MDRSNRINTAPITTATTAIPSTGIGANGTSTSSGISSESEPPSTEPPKQNFNSNINNNRQNVEKYTDSVVLSNIETNDILSDENKLKKIVSVSGSSIPNAQNNNTANDNSHINNNKLKEHRNQVISGSNDIDNDKANSAIDDCITTKSLATTVVDIPNKSLVTPITTTTELLINRSANNKNDNNIDNNFVVLNSLQSNNDQSISKENSIKSVANNSSSTNLNSDRNSTDTFSSDSIDVTTNTKCQDRDEGDEIKLQSNGVSDSLKGSTTSSVMDDDNSLRQPLLGTKSSNNGSDYHSITESNKTNAIGGDTNRKGNDIDSHSKRVLYNDYVNLLCDTDISGSLGQQRNSNAINNSTGRRDENRPLLQQQQQPHSLGQMKSKSIQKPKSIVKSPSTQNFGSHSDKFYEKNRKPRLSIQCTGSDPDRPVLHVQFLSQHNQPHCDEDESGMAKSYPPSHIPSYQNDCSTSGGNKTINNGDSMPSGSNRFRSSISSTSSESTSSSDSSESSSSSDDGSSIGQFAEAKPPDGGWGWVVVFASFMVNLIADGITFSFGVIYVELLKYFGEGKAKTAWIGSLFMAMPLLSGPIASFLTDRYGCRKVTIVGSILASIGFFISSFTDSIEMLFFTFGIFAGFGLSLCYVAAVVIVAYYFDKRRSFATGLSVCGSGIGTFIFAPLTQVLIDEYGWRGTTLILSGLFLNMTVCGMLMRDLEWTTYKSKQKAKQRIKKNKLAISAESFSASNSTNTGGTTSNLHKDETNGYDVDRSDENGECSLANQSVNYEDDPRLFSSLITFPTFVKNGEKVPVEVLELLSTNRNINNVLLKNYPGLAHSRSFSQPLTTTRHSNSSNIPLENSLSPTGGNTEPDNAFSRSKSRRIRNEQAFLTWLKEDGSARHPKDVRMLMHQHRHPGHHHHPTAAYLKDLRMHRHSLTYRGAMLNINRYRLRASSCPDIYRNSMTTIAKEKTQWGQGVEEFRAVVLDMLDFSFFSDIRFTLFALSNFFLYTWYDVPYVYLADNAIEIGYTETDASILISMIGIVNMFGEIILGWFGDRKFVTAGMIYAICMLFCGLSTGLVPLLKTYVGLSVISGFFGLFIAANYALTSIILVELITLDRFTNAYGLLLLVQGIANLIGPPLAGWITDYTGNYDLAFYLAGFFIAISGLLMLILPARGKIKRYRAIRRNNSEVQDDEDDDEDDDEVIRNDVEKRIRNEKSNHQNIVAPKSALKFNGTTKNILANKNSISSNDKNTKINEV